MGYEDDMSDYTEEELAQFISKITLRIEEKKIGMKQEAKIKELMDELLQTGINIRGDWSCFDGRELLEALELWLAKLGDVLNIESPKYYDDTSRMSHRWQFKISEWF